MKHFAIIQKQFRNNKQKIEALKITTDILNDIIDLRSENLL